MAAGAPYESVVTMKHLKTQDEFEALIGRAKDADGNLMPAPSGATVVYFTAPWCGACRRLDINRLLVAIPKLNWYKVDVDENTYTPGFCGIRAIPSFLFIKDGKVVGSALQSNDTMKVLAWIQEQIAGN